MEPSSCPTLRSSSRGSSSVLAVVLDLSALIPCGDKPDRDEEAIRWLGDALTRVEGLTMYLSPRLIKAYATVLPRELSRHRGLPRLQVGLLRALKWLKNVRRCKDVETRAAISIHVLEASKVGPYDVDGLGLSEEDDKEVLRVALAASRHSQAVLLITVDEHLLGLAEGEGVDRRLATRYPVEAQRLRILRPSDEALKQLLAALSL